MQRIMIVGVLMAVGAGFVSAFAVSQLTDRAGAEPACPGNPNPPATLSGHAVSSCYCDA